MRKKRAKCQVCKARHHSMDARMAPRIRADGVTQRRLATRPARPPNRSGKAKSSCARLGTERYMPAGARAYRSTAAKTGRASPKAHQASAAHATTERVDHSAL